MDGDDLPYKVLAQVILRRFKLTKNIETIKGYTFSSLKAKTTKLPIFAFENLPDFLHSKRQKA